MLKEAIEKIVELSKPTITQIEGCTFAIGTSKDGMDIKEIHPVIDVPETIGLSSLDSLVKMIRTEAIPKYAVPIYITIPSHTSVKCYSQPNAENRFIRNTYYQAVATDVPGWEGKTTLSFEEAMIALRTRFQETNDTEYALKLLSEITTGAKVTFNDSGIATSVVTKTGIDLQSNQQIRPIITLKPYRTFQEIEQPASQFLIRVSERGISFIEADGGMWKLKARQTIKEYLDQALSAEAHDGSVVIAL